MQPMNGVSVQVDVLLMMGDYVMYPLRRGLARLRSCVMGRNVCPVMRLGSLRKTQYGGLAHLRSGGLWQGDLKE